ncbi:hypothetical protein SFRURICE_019629 [Spodoptera frugiperda]|nr:hypothetical protein SFRURICE_019629 [Spodoptera frugiperda]
MLKMSSQLDNIISAYKTLTKIPSVAGGKLNNAATRITAKWSVRNLDKGKNTAYTTSYSLDGDLNVIAQSDFGNDVSNEKLTAVSPRETFKALIREENNGKDAKKQYLELWTKSSLAQSVDLTSLDIHGDTSLVYVAEKKLPKFEPYIKRKAEDKPKLDGSGETAPKKGEEHIYRQDWGEQLVGKHLSVVVVFQLASETFTILSGIPDGMCPGQVRFSPDGSSIVGVVWKTEPRRLGLIFCTNRPSYIFECTLDGTFKKLSGEGLAGEVTTVIDIVDTEVKTATGQSFHGVYCQALPARCFASDGRLVLSTPQKNEVRSYVVDMDSGKIWDISNKSWPCSTSVLDVRGDVILATCSSLIAPGQVYIARLPAADSEAGTKWSRVTFNGAVPGALYSATVLYLDLKHDSEDAVKSFTALYLSPETEERKLPLIVWPHGGPHSNFVNSFSIEAALFTMMGFASLQVNYRGSTGAGQDSVQFLLKRVGDTDVKDCKLATDYALKTFTSIDPNKVCLTGGSHGGFLVTHLSGQYPDVYAAVVSRNPVTDVASFASARINYRGSTGQGDKHVRCLIAHVGDYDVQDCCLTLNTLLERDGRLCEKSVVLYGGSYGGLVVAHLAGLYPDRFKALVMRNPLIDLATKGQYADNSDGCAVEAGFEFTEKGPVSEEQLLAMRRCSPIAHVHKVKAPTALMLGSGDKRVPHFQGLEIYMYDDNHSLSSPAAEMDNLINGTHWFMHHLDL